MAENVIKMRKQLLAAAPLLPLPVEMMKKKLLQQARALLPDLPPVQLVSLWGLFNAGVVFFLFAIYATLAVINPRVPSWMIPPPEVMDSPTRAEDNARVSVLVLGSIWCTVAQAAAAALALLAPAIPSHRRLRRALAYVVVAAAVASHCLVASAVGIFRAAPPTSSPGYATFHAVGRISNYVDMLFLATGDVVCFLALLVGSKEE